MVSLFCEIFHWHLDDVLKLRARAFFALLKEVNTIRKNRDLSNYIELVKIAWTPGCGSDYGKKIIGEYVARLKDGSEQRPEPPPTIGMDPSDPYAIEFMTKSFDTYRRFAGG